MGEKIGKQGRKRTVRIEMGRQGKLIGFFLVILFGYFGIIANILMYNELGQQISYEEFDATVLIWSFLVYPSTYFLPPLLLFVTCAVLTYLEDIPYYGIKAAIWFVPFIILFSFVWYWVIDGFSIIPLKLFFLDLRGYVTLILIFSINLLGAYSGMKYKFYRVKKRSEI